MPSLSYSSTARRRFRLDEITAGATAAPARGSRLAANLPAARKVVARVNATLTAGEPSAQAGELAALELLHEIFHLVVARAAELNPDAAMDRTAAKVRADLGDRRTTTLLDAVAGEFEGVAAAPAPGRLEEMLLLRVANENPAARPLRPLINDAPLPRQDHTAAMASLEAYQAALPPVGPNGETLVDLLRAPAREHPESLAGQLRYVQQQWGEVLGEALAQLLDRMLLTLDVIAEEERGMALRFGIGPGAGRHARGGAGDGRGAGERPDLGGLDAEPERFSSDSDWMPRLVLVAKSTHVWLDQLSRRYGRDIRTLDAIPDEELERLARLGITGLWLIGLWERSKASRRIKVWRGNQDAAASAYSLDDYRIADDLGGEGAWVDLRHRAWAKGVRLASDMVPNHMGIDSNWVTDHPDWFLGLPEPPYPAYTFNGENLGEHDRIEVRLEDHYWDNSDAAVVFERRDRWTGERRYIYHGNDGTSFPWNDTAQLDFSKAEVREQVIGTILAVARRFPVIRFDAAMVLAKKHVRRLWFPAPGEGSGGIPSRAEHGTMTAEEFEAAMPLEFWREVVDRVAAEVPDTLLLAEAFWLLEGYFVRTLGMHRVYNSAFMHMLRDEDNAGYRRVLKETLEFDPEILKRYVNFMNNPDEKTAVEQFGKGDKYFGVATLLATLPGLPMFGHGQFEGFSEKYGMEFRRATRDEHPDEWLVARHEREIVPLLHRRGDFAEAADYLLYDVAHEHGGVEENVYAYSNGRGAARSLVVYHNRYGDTAGWVRDSAAFAVKEPNGDKHLERRTLAQGLGVADGPAEGRFLAYREQRSGLEYLRPLAEVRERGLHVRLRAYESRVFWQFRELADRAGVWARLAERLGGAGVPSLDDALRDQALGPVHDTLRSVLSEATPEAIGRFVAQVADTTGTAGDRGAVAALIAARVAAVAPIAAALPDPSQGAALEVWAILAPLGTLPAGAMAGPTARAWFEELRLAPVIAGALRGRGLDEGTAWWAAERARLLLDLPLPSWLAASPAGVEAVADGADAEATAADADADVASEPVAADAEAVAAEPVAADAAVAADADADEPVEAVEPESADALALRLVDAWLIHPDVRPFLRVNAWEGVEWFHGESWDELVAWAERLERVSAGITDASDATPDEARAVLRVLQGAAEIAGFRVDRLRVALGAEAEAEASAETQTELEAAPESAADAE